MNRLLEVDSCSVLKEEIAELVKNGALDVELVLLASTFTLIILF